MTAPHGLPRLDPDSLPPAVDVSDNTAALAEVDAVIEQGPFSADWDSLRDYEVPRWYADAKFGIFLHWGVYSVPAFSSEWYSRTMYLEGNREHAHHLETYGPHSEFGYKDFIPSFTMEDYDPAAWAALFRRAGAQFVVPVAEHHDGFAMYQSDRTRWNAAQMGPRRDVMGELLAASDDASITRGASSHRAEHWFFMNGGARFDSDVLDPAYQDFYGPAQREETAPNERHLEDWLLRTVEIIDRYRPQVLWFDWWIEQPAFEPSLRRLAAYYYNRAAEWGREVVINYKWEAFAEGSAVYDIERGTMGGIRPVPWQNDTSVSRSSWCWVEGHEYKSLGELIIELADTVSKNGNLLLNIGPKPNGTIASEEQEMLESIGAWLTENGQSIFGTRPWIVAEEGPTRSKAGSFVDGAEVHHTAADFRFTTRHDVTGDYVYAIALAHPEDGVLRIRSFGTGLRLLPQEIRSVSLLGGGEPLGVERTEDALEVTVGPAAGSPIGPVVKIHLEPEVVPERTDHLHG